MMVSRWVGGCLRSFPRYHSHAFPCIASFRARDSRISPHACEMYYYHLLITPQVLLMGGAEVSA